VKKWGARRRRVEPHAGRKEARQTPFPLPERGCRNAARH
jgi:hypothetical protein